MHTETGVVAAATELANEIAKWVYKLYDVTADEIEMVERD